MGGYAWVTLATNDSYSLGAMVLAHSLRRVGTKHDLVILVSPGVTEAMRERLAAVFSLVKEVNLLDSKDKTNLSLLARPELGVTFTKIHCWRLTQYDKCVFLDADTLVVKNCDELFDREELSAAPDVGWPDCFNSGVFVFKPSEETYDSIAAFAVAKGSFDGGDQGLLNMYFSDWAWKDISKHLPFIYNMCSMATYSYLPAFKQFGEDVRIIHFIGKTKPWLQYFDTLTGLVHPAGDAHHLRPLLQLWWSIFVTDVHPQLSPVMARSTLATNWHLPTSQFFFPNDPVNPPPSTPSTTVRPCDDHGNYESRNVPSVPDFSEFKDPWENYRAFYEQTEDFRQTELSHDYSNSFSGTRETQGQFIPFSEHSQSDEIHFIHEHFQEHCHSPQQVAHDTHENTYGENYQKTNQDAEGSHEQVRDQQHHDSQQQHFHQQYHDSQHQHFHQQQHYQQEHHDHQQQHYQQEHHDPHQQDFHQQLHDSQHQHFHQQDQNDPQQQHFHQQLHDSQQQHFHQQEQNDPQQQHFHQQLHDSQHQHFHQQEQNDPQQQHFHQQLHDSQHQHFHQQHHESPQQNFHEQHHDSPQQNHHEQHHDSPQQNYHEQHHQQHEEKHQEIRWNGEVGTPEHRKETDRLDNVENNNWSRNDLSVIDSNIATKRSTTNAPQDDSRTVVSNFPTKTVVRKSRSTPSSRTPKRPRDKATIPDKTGRIDDSNAGIAGALAQMKLGEARSPEQIALEEHMRKQSWEEGHIDYMGRDSFDNIWKKISETLSFAPQRQPTPPKDQPEPEETVKEVTATPLEKEEEDVRQAEVIDESAVDASLISKTPVENVAAEGTPVTTEQPVLLEQTETRQDVAKNEEIPETERPVAPQILLEEKDIVPADAAAAKTEEVVKEKELSSGTPDKALGEELPAIPVEKETQKDSPVVYTERTEKCPITAKNLEQQLAVAVSDTALVTAMQPFAEQIIASVISEQQTDNTTQVVKQEGAEEVTKQVYALPDIPSTESTAEKDKVVLTQESPKPDLPAKSTDYERQLSERIAVAEETTSASPVPIQVAESVLQTEPKTALESREGDLASEEAISTVIAPVCEIATRSAEVFHENQPCQVPPVTACNGSGRLELEKDLLGPQTVQSAQLSRVVEPRSEQELPTVMAEEDKVVAEDKTVVQGSAVEPTEIKTTSKQEEVQDKSTPSVPKEEVKGEITVEASKVPIPVPTEVKDIKPELSEVVKPAETVEKESKVEEKKSVTTMCKFEPKEEPKAPVVEAVKTPEVEAVTAPVVAAVKAPEVAAVKAPEVAAVKAPEVAAVKAPEVAAVKAPEVAAVKAAEVEAVKVPEVKAVKTPEVEAVKAPEVEAAPSPASAQQPEKPERSSRTKDQPATEAVAAETLASKSDPQAKTTKKSTKKPTKKSSEGEAADKAEDGEKKTTKKLTKKSSESEAAEGAEDAEKKTTKKLTKKSSESETTEGAEDVEKKTKKLTKKSSESETTEGAEDAEKKTTKKVVKKVPKKPKDGQEEGTESSSSGEKPKKPVKVAKKSSKSGQSQEAEASTPETTSDAPVPPKRKVKATSKTVKPEAE